MLRVGAVVLVMVPVMGLLGACSVDDPPPAEPEAAPTRTAVDGEAVRAGLFALFAGDHADAATQEDARCFADALLDRVSLDRLEDARVLVAGAVVDELPPLPDDLATDWVDAQLACTDYLAASTEAQVRISKGQVDGPAYAACLRERLPDDTVRAALAAGLTGAYDDPAVAELGQAQADCARTARTG